MENSVKRKKETGRRRKGNVARTDGRKQTLDEKRKKETLDTLYYALKYI